MVKLEIAFDLMSTAPIVKEIIHDLGLEVVPSKNNLSDDEFFITVEDPFQYLLSICDSDSRFFLSGMANTNIPTIYLTVDDKIQE